MFTFHELRSKLKEAEGWSRNYFKSDTEELSLLEKTDNSECQSLDPSEDRAPGKLRLVLCITTNIVSTVSIVSDQKDIPILFR
jgi:solute carrier family 35 protein E3